MSHPLLDALATTARRIIEERDALVRARREDWMFDAAVAETELAAALELQARQRAQLLGKRFVITYTNPWSGPCPHCGRRRALKRTSKGVKPCTQHEPAHGTEVSVYRAEVTEVHEGGISYKTLQLLDVLDAMPGPSGPRKVESGGMTFQSLADDVASARIILEKA